MERKAEIVVFLILAVIFITVGYLAFKKYSPKIDSVLPTPVVVR
ncbi:MAG TPA: hypothetical protein VFI61_04485 [Patescibacteria group bacterium]|nr:hypothetical protein [Patescibacteria group bacterium]